METAELLTHPDYELFRPLVTGWVAKLEAAFRARKKWQDVADECEMFYSKSAAAMWDPTYTRRFWRAVRAPKFRITINKAFELVAVFAPNLLWEVPHRQVQPKKPLQLPPELFNQDEQNQQLFQFLSQQLSQEHGQDKLVAFLMERWLNYTPREQPGGGLANHSELAVIDALVKGRGCLWIRPYQFPASGRTLTGAFREPPENLLIDPDYQDHDAAKWIALRHVDPHWEVERRFKLPKGSLQNRSSLESSWHASEVDTASGGAGMHRAAGLTNDLVVWYEIWSKTGPGARLSGMETTVKEHLERVVGDYAYLAIAPSVPFPLNCSSDSVKKGDSNESVKQKFGWPVPLWSDDRWPVEVLDFYPDPNAAWPIPPLAPALGELKFLNFLVPWLANRIYSSSRDFWAVAGPHVEHYTKYLQEGLDQTVIPTPVGVQDVRQAIQVLTQPETRMDAWRIIELVSGFFDKRTGLTEMAYGRNEGGTQNRTAEETIAKARAVGVRPEHMQKKVVAWQSRVAAIEAFVTRWFVNGNDVAPLLGRLGQQLWEQLVMSTDVELVVRQMQYTVAASSIRRPNRDRDVANFQQVMSIFAPVAQQHGAATGNYNSFNAIMRKWGELHDMDLKEAELESYDPNEQAAQQQQAEQQMEMQRHQLEMQKLQAELGLKQLDAQAKQQDAQSKQLLAALGLEAKRAETELDLQKSMAEGAIDSERATQELEQDAAQHMLDMVQDRQKFNQDLQQQKALGQLKLELARKQAAAKPAPTNGSTKK